MMQSVSSIDGTAAGRGLCCRGASVRSWKNEVAAGYRDCVMLQRSSMSDLQHGSSTGQPVPGVWTRSSSTRNTTRALQHSKLLGGRRVHADWRLDCREGQGLLDFQPWSKHEQGSLQGRRRGSRSRQKTCSILSPEREVETSEGATRHGESGGKGSSGEGERVETTSSLLKPLKPRGSMTLGEQQIVLDPYEAVQDSDSESDRESGTSGAGIGQIKRKKVDPSKVESQSKVQLYQAQVRKKGEDNGVAEKAVNGSIDDASSDGNNGSKVKDKQGKTRRNRVGQSLRQANGAVRVVKSTSEGMLSESVARLTEALEKVVGGGRIGGVPLARIIAKGVSGAVKGGAAASMAESVGMHGEDS